MASPRSSSLCRALVAALLVSAGCVTVRPQDRELLADPAMVYGGGAPARHEQHVLENREGARAAMGTGGGCGCN